jgi:hypothetical protein
MPAVNRYQLVGVIALGIFVLGLVRAGSILFGPSGFGGGDAPVLAPEGQAPLTLPRERDFPVIPAAVARDPFEAASVWRPPSPERLDPPPFAELLRLEPAPLLLAPDAVPRLGAAAPVAEARADAKILTQLRRLFRATAGGDG